MLQENLSKHMSYKKHIKKVLSTSYAEAVTT